MVSRLMCGLLSIFCACYLFFGFYDYRLCISGEHSKRLALEHNLLISDIAILNQQMNMTKTMEIIDHINVIRPVGSKNHLLVRQYIQSFFETLDWKVSVDSFSRLTVIGQQTFHNIIATNNPYTPRRLVLACHYDSKMMQDFYGTIDSAIPCSIILAISEALTTYLNNSKADIGLMAIFFDGEEAFETWSSFDSLYGSRNLASKMSVDIDGCSELSKIDLFILLDLLGAPGTKIPRFAYCDSRFYDLLVDIERKSKSANSLQLTEGSYFYKHIHPGNIEDDHIPFLERGVPIMHVIPAPFPPQWHTTQDTLNNTHMDVVRDMQLLFTSFICQYFRLNPSI